MTFRVPPAWVIVLSGLILNILAIVISSLVIDKLSAKQNDLYEQKSANLYSIQLAWNSVETLERKREALLLHLNSERTVPQLDEILRGQLSVWVGESMPPVIIANLPTFMMSINSAQQAQRNKIDDYYLNNLSISESMQALEERMTFYKNIALFLQIFGLALILARDLARKP